MAAKSCIFNMARFLMISIVIEIPPKYAKNMLQINDFAPLLNGNSFESIQIHRAHRSDQYKPSNIGIDHVGASYIVRKLQNFE